MTALGEDVFDPPFILHEPRDYTAPFVFSVPHSGNVYPDEFVEASRLNERTLRRSEDAFVDRMFSGMTALGAPVLSARFPRAYLDVNREPYELEPRLFEGKLPPYANTRSSRVLGGLGTIPRIVAEGYEIYRSKLTIEEGLRRIETLYRPYHAALRSLIDRALARHGFVFLIDCHSMPSSGLVSGERGRRPDVVLGDRFGTSCSPQLVEMVDLLFSQQGYATTRNRPYAGGFITEFYGQPTTGCHALQVELNRALYMDEELIEPLPEFSHIAGDLWAIFHRVADLIGGTGGSSHAAAAE